MGTMIPNDALIAYWASKAKGGIGLIITQVHSIYPSSFRFPGALEGFRKAGDEVHKYGAKIFAHSGMVAIKPGR